MNHISAVLVSVNHEWSLLCCCLIMTKVFSVILGKPANCTSLSAVDALQYRLSWEMTGLKNEQRLLFNRKLLVLSNMIMKMILIYLKYNGEESFIIELWNQDFSSRRTCSSILLVIEITLTFTYCSSVHYFIIMEIYEMHLREKILHACTKSRCSH